MSECTQTDKKRFFSKGKVTLLILATLLVAFLISLYVSNACIKITHHTLESEKITSPVRLAVISDLHSKEFANSNADLYSKIANSKPDLILTVGDMIADKHCNEQGIDYHKEMLSNLCHIAPVYCSLGNHERHSKEFEGIKESIAQSGAVLLEKSSADVELNGNKIRLFGLSYYLSWDEEANNFISEALLTDSDVFSLLLCHNPEFYVWGIKNYPIDLMVSGHTHGGMLKLPVLGPVYAPEQGWFPQYAAGFYKGENGHLAVTTGLGSSPEYMPRVFNRPEIMIIDVK